MKKTKVSVHVALLILILIASFLIRIIGTNPGFWEFHPDEPTTYVEAADMYMNSDINPRRFDYAAGIPLVHLVAFKTIFIPIRYAKLIITEPQTLVLALKNFDNFPQNLTFVIFGYRYLDALFWSRYVVAFLGAVSVYVLYVLTKKLFDWKTALIAAFLFAFNYRHVLSSHFALADIQNILTYLIATLGAVNLYYSNSRKNYILAGIYVGLSFSMKYQILSILPFGMVHLIWAWRERSFKYILNKNVILAGLALVATFLVLNPYLPSHIKPVPINIRVQSFITSNQVTARRYSFGSNVFNPFSYFYLYKWGVGRAISISILLGGVVMALRDKQRFLILASLIIPYFYLFTYYGGAGAGYYVRNFGVVIPFMLIFSAYLFTATYKFLKKRIKISKTLLNVSTVVLLLVISFSQIKASVALAYYYSMPWTHVELAKWAGDHIPHDAVMEEGSGVIQGELRKVGFNKIPRWLRDRESVMSMAEIREDEADFAVIVSNEIGHQFISWMNPLTASELLKYDGIPFERLNNTYFGLTVNEMLNYLVYEIYHKVSVPVNSRFIVKIPSMSSTKNGVVLKEMGFDEVNQIWRMGDADGRKVSGLFWKDEIGRSKVGSLGIGQQEPRIARFSSLPISIEAGKYYRAIGWVKNSREVLKEERSSFLRLDFYESTEEAVLNQMGLAVSVSARVWGSEEWHKVIVEGRSPENAKFMTVSFQKDRLYDYSAYLDDVQIFEVDPPEETFPDVPYIKSTVTTEYIYPKAIL